MGPKIIAAKFRCTRTTKDEYQNEIVTFTAATGSGNEDWSQYTPNGSLEMTISGASGAKDFFKPGTEYMLHLSEAPADNADAG